MGRKGRRFAMAATVLVVEDEGKLRELVRSYLEQAGFTVLSTGSGAEAITVAGRPPRGGRPATAGRAGY
jgi:DNA-binding NtrC family response regulator